MAMPRATLLKLKYNRGMAVKKTDYKTLSAQLDDIVEQIQSGEMDIEVATVAYEKGMAIIKQLESHLKLAENKITKIQKQFGG